MEASVTQVNNNVQTQNVQTQNVQTAQPVQKDAVSEAESFKTALQEVNAEPQATDASANKAPETNASATKTEQGQVPDAQNAQNQAVANKNDANVQANAQQQQQQQQLQLQQQIVFINNQKNPQAGNMVSENLQNAVLQQQNKKLDSEKNLHQKLNKNDLVSKSQQLLNGEIVNVLNQQSDLNANLMTPVQAQQSSAEALVQATTSPLNQIIAELGKPQLNPLQDNAIQTISELNSKISDINSITSKSNKSTLGSIKLNMEDADFFINLTQTQVNDALQANITINAQNQVTLTEAKAQAVQSSAAVSQALIDKLQESMNTNKSFRVDFDNDIAVIMRVDSKGVLSANFLPGSSAVEQYLRNNLAELRQSFENKGLEYNELSYSSKKQNQQKQQRQQKGGQNE